jgi:hypothetical protein
MTALSLGGDPGGLVLGHSLIGLALLLAPETAGRPLDTDSDRPAG